MKVDGKYQAGSLTVPNNKNEKERLTSGRMTLRRAPLFHRSNSISIPVSHSCNTSTEEDTSTSRILSKCSSYGTNGSVSQHLAASDPLLHQSSSNYDKSIQHNINPKQEHHEAGVRLYFGYTKHQLKVFIALMLLSLDDLVGYSAIAPFFPVEAEKKGLSSLHIGLIFSSYSLCGIFASIFVGTVFVKVGAKFCVLAGMFWSTGATLCFGFLDKTAPTPFFILSVIARGMIGIGSNTAFTAMYAIVFHEFSERAITVMSLAEAVFGVGGILAPVIGGALYDIGGYITPFMALGGTQALLLILCYFMLPSVPVEQQIASKSPLYLLSHSSGLLSTFIVVFIFLCNSFLTANLSPFLDDQFQMNATMAGVVFLTNSAFYAGMTPVWGYLADKWKNSYLLEVCTFGVGVGMVLVGPALCLRRLFGWTSQREWLLFLAAVINGAFFGGALMPTFNEMLLAAKELNLNDSVLVQYGLVSGLFNVAFSIGDILGPTLGGLAVEQIGFANAAAVLGLTGFFIAIMKLLQRYYRYRTSEDRLIGEDTEPLLGDNLLSVNS